MIGLSFFKISEAQELVSIVDTLTGKIGFIDKNDSLVVPYIYESHNKCTYEFKDSICLVRRNCKYGYINSIGKEFIECKYTYLGPLSEGLIASVYKDTIPISSYLDTKGDVVLKIRGWFPSDFHSGLARYRSNGKYGYINKVGVIVIPNIYDYASDFDNGKATVNFEDKEIRVINTQGDILTKRKFPRNNETE